jgi:hypothetical protein
VAAAGASLAHGSAVARNLPRYHWEDWRFFRHTREHVHSPVDCFTQPSAWPGLYRPLSTNCYYLAGRALWGNRVAPYHVFNAAVFVVNALLLFALARRLLPLPLALVAVGLWTSRVAPRQVLLYTSEFQALGSTFFALVALLLALPPRLAGAPPETSRAREAGALAAFAAALLSKESTVALPAVVTAATWLYGARPWWKRDLLWWALAGAWALAFTFVFRGVSGYEPTGFAYDVSLRALHRLAAYALMMSNAVVLPVDDWTAPPRIPLLAAQPLVLAALAVAAAAILALAAVARRESLGVAAPARTMALGLTWFVAGAAPFVVLEDRLFLRYVYFPSAGMAVLLAAMPAAAAAWWRLRSRTLGGLGGEAALR